MSFRDAIPESIDHAERVGLDEIGRKFCAVCNEVARQNDTETHDHHICDVCPLSPERLKKIFGVRCTCVDLRSVMAGCPPPHLKKMTPDTIITAAQELIESLDED